MERQLAVWAAPILVLVAVLVGVLFGHAPGKRPAARAVANAEPEEAAPETVTPTPAPKPAEKPAPEPEPEEPVEPEPEPPKPAPEPEPEPEEVKPAEPTIEKTGDGPTGTVVGRVVVGGKAPKAKPDISVAGQQLEDCCAEDMDRGDRSLVLGAGGGVSFAVVEIKTKEKADGTGQTFVLDQKCCRFEPHVLAVPMGATIEYKNSDPIGHNVNSLSRKNTPFNNNVGANSSFTKVAEKNEAIPIACDIHPWMKATVYAAKSPYFSATGPDGSFEIPDVPPGKYSVDVWHERGKAKGKVEVVAGATTTVELQLKVK